MRYLPNDVVMVKIVRENSEGKLFEVYEHRTVLWEDHKPGFYAVCREDEVYELSGAMPSFASWWIVPFHIMHTEDARFV